MPRTKATEDEMVGMYYPAYPGKIQVTDKEEDMSLYSDSEKVDLFHIGQSYVNEPVKTLQCDYCGGIEFNVGTVDYFTAIRCVKCEWEACVQNG